MNQFRIQSHVLCCYSCGNTVYCMTLQHMLSKFSAAHDFYSIVDSDYDDYDHYDHYTTRSDHYDNYQDQEDDYDYINDLNDQADYAFNLAELEQYEGEAVLAVNFNTGASRAIRHAQKKKDKAVWLRKKAHKIMAKRGYDMTDPYSCWKQVLRTKYPDYAHEVPHLRFPSKTEKE